MTLRSTSYRFYFRLWFYLLPALSFALALYARFYVPSQSAAPLAYDKGFYLVVWLITTVAWSVAAEHSRLSQIDELFQGNTGMNRAFVAVGYTYLTVLCVLFFYREQNMSRLVIAGSALLLFIATVASRACFRRLLRGVYSRRRLRVLMVGADRHASGVARRMSRIPCNPSEVVGHLRVNDQELHVPSSAVYDFDAVEEWQGIAFDEIVIALPPSQLGLLSALTKRLEPLQVPIRTVLDVGDIPVIRDRLFQLGGLQFLDIKTTPLDNPTYFALKRAFDIVLSLLVLLAGFPLFVLIAALVKVSSRGPVFFKQERIGLNGRPFVMYKFRTMFVAPPGESNSMHTTKNDPRRTEVGSWLRQTSLDEVPQFLNVLKGDMSIVGPRPEITFFARKFAQEVLNYDTRHRLKVGITGWAQVNGWRGDTSIQRRIDADLYYLQNWTFWLDLRIMAMTVLKGMVSDHAY
jgi:Undecaprenyl-phosphate glucose phosphotransferase